MKKKIIAALIVFAAVMGAIFAWRLAYSMRQSNDNLPELSAIAEMKESDVNSLLPGYKINQLKEVWGEPDFSEENTAIWNIDDVVLVVNYKNNGVVAICGIKEADSSSAGEY